MKNSAETALAPQGLSANLVKNLRSYLGKNLLPSLTIAAAASTGLVGLSAWRTWSVQQDFREAVSQSFELQKLSDRVVYLDELLTMSAKMAASTSNTNWEKRYNSFAPELNRALISLSSFVEGEKGKEQSDTANKKLLEFEARAFDFVRDGESHKAISLLRGDEYQQEKQIYSERISKKVEFVQESVQDQINRYSNQLFRSALFATLSFPILLVSWTVVLLMVRNYIREQAEAQTNITKLNSELENRVELRTQQLSEKEQAIREESEQLQADIGEILEVVVSLEEGDLTTEAPVSDRLTGLVSDTLNRLIEELGRVLGQVSQASTQVSMGAQQLEGMADTVAENTGSQARSVHQVLALTEGVEQSAKDSLSQIQETMATLRQLSASAEQGQVTMGELDKGIEILQQGTERMVQQMKTLGEFVGLTDQFLQEQSQIAGMTQVLAMNASLVAARGSEQRDPSQFVVVAREFEAIANQVGGLAQRTSSGLSLLEQRSGQIHSVVSSVDANVQELAGLVRDFNQGVEQSRDAFSSVTQATQESVQAGESLHTANARIDEAAQATASLMRDIADFSQQTARLTRQSRDQSGQMEELSNQLIKAVEFFKLPQVATAAAIATSQYQEAQSSPSSSPDSNALVSSESASAPSLPSRDETAAMADVASSDVADSEIVDSSESVPAQG